MSKDNYSKLHNCTRGSRKIRGIFYNFDASPTEEHMEFVSKQCDKINAESLNVHQQSIHHVNIYHHGDRSLKSFTICLRKHGVKTEDINKEELYKLDDKSEYVKSLIQIAETVE